ncbi:alanine--tRNA ligase-related protein [Candidatus Portiera aleyrodidarum]|uniref:alanine--tRNA ligase-related protein n=1 Tax=Candidatus Portiera aleyrodidarum TaxID=91844 RepID=UPI002A4E2E79|nr:alanine--tRNA ligase-related protein [Candidatus Portiera aleyrodidarum]
MKDSIITQNFFFSNIYFYKTKIQKILNKEGKNINFISENTQGTIILKISSFIFEKGGQVISDVGYIYNKVGKFKVYNVIKHNSLFFHVGTLLKGYFSNTTHVKCYIDKIIRYNISVAHSAIHLLNVTIQRVAKNKLIKKGFFINQNKIIFEYKSYKPLTNKILFIIELLINRAIAKQHIILIKLLSKQKKNIKHKNVVVIGKEGGYSIDVCNGTHIKTTKNIGCFCIMSEQCVSKGIRRIEAVTNKNAVRYILNNKLTLKDLSFASNLCLNNVKKNIKHLKNKNKVLLDEFNLFKQITIQKQINKLLSKMFYFFGYKFLIYKIKSKYKKDLFVILHSIVNKLVNKSIIIVYVLNKHNINVFIKITNDCLKFRPYSVFFKQVLQTNKTIFYNATTNVSYLKTSINNFNMLYTKTLKTNIKTFLLKRGL